MQKLKALDANFLYSESERTPNNISSVQILELPDECSLDEFISSLRYYFMERIHLVPYLTRKLKFTPGNIDHPVWVKDKNFDLNNHFEHIKLALPGSFSQLEETVAKIHAKLMDRDKPLWKLFLISGLEGGKIAYYNQAHHAAMDGMAGQAATMIMMDTTAKAQPIEPATEKPTEDDSLSELLRLSFDNLVNYQIDSPVQALNILGSAFRMAKRAFDPNMPFNYIPAATPKTRFNRCIEKKRTYAAGDIPVADLKRMAKMCDGTLNDVLLAICAGGLRRYLLRTNELPARTLVAGCPVSLRQPGDVSMDNKVSIMSVALGTDIEDPRLRLNAIIDTSRIAKEVSNDTAALQNLQISLAGFPAWLTSSYRMSETLRLAEILPIPFNLIISNVPGPRKTLYSNGAKMLTHYPVSIPTHGLGLNITASSYVNTLCFSVTSCAKAVPNAGIIRDDILAAWEELRSTLIPRATISSESTIVLGGAKISRPVIPMPTVTPTADVTVGGSR